MSDVQRYVLDTGPFLLTFTEEDGSEKIRKIIRAHETGQTEAFIHPNNLAEGYKVISTLQSGKKLKSPDKNFDPRNIVRSAYATLSVIQNEITTINLGVMKMKYHNKPWGDLSSAALAISLSTEEKKVPVVILEHERHFGDIEEVRVLRVSEL
jgi:hypothetical protein